MDLTVLSKKISSYRTPKGRITNLPNELLAEILYAWEQWTGPAASCYKLLGADQRKMAKLMGKAKQPKRDGAFDDLRFTSENSLLIQFFNESSRRISPSMLEEYFIFRKTIGLAAGL